MCRYAMISADIVYWEREPTIQIDLIIKHKKIDSDLAACSMLVYVSHSPHVYIHHHLHVDVVDEGGGEKTKRLTTMLGLLTNKNIQILHHPVHAPVN